MRPSLRTLIAPVAFALSLSAPALAAVQNRITAQIQDNPATRVSLSETVHPQARAARDLGPAPADRKLDSLTLRFNLTAAAQASLNQLLLDQQNPSSPRYHQWLTPEQYAAQFGLSQADLTSVSNWLTSQGLTVTGAARSRTFVTFSGTVAQVQKAFGTTIHTLSLNGETHIANLTEATLPSALASVVTGITGLNDFKLKPRARTRKVQADVKPDFTSSVSGNHYIAPGDFYTIYDVSPLLSTSINGSGITIAVMGQTDISLPDAAAFRAASGLAANPPTVRLFGTDPGTRAGDINEAMLDVEWSGAAAPSATILYVNSTDVVGTSLTQAIDGNLAPIVTISYGDCEANWGASALNTYNQLFRQANAQGMTVIGPAGDSGATDCDASTSTTTVTSATQGLAVDFPASSPYVTGAGGTMFNEGSGTYWSTTNNGNGGSATSYIPESVWNETAAGGALAATGGGASAFFPKPAWQVGTGVPSDFARDVPDFALSSSATHDGFLYCSQGFCVNGFRDSSGYLNVVGGTSVAAPTFGGILALLEQKIGSRIGNANPTLYGLAGSVYYNNVFHDITSGNNASPCTAGTPNCFTGGTIGYSAGVGYDLATGWGSIDAFNLVNDWSLATAAGSSSGIGTVVTSTTITASKNSVVAGTSVALTVNVASLSSGSTATPTGTVQLTVDNVPVGSALTLAGGAATYTLGTTSLVSGSHTVAASYSGDSTYAGSKGSIALDIISSGSPDFALTPSTVTTTVASGGSATGIPFTVTSNNGFSGSVTFSLSTNSSVLASSSSFAFSVDPVTVTSTTSGTTVLTMNAYLTNGVTATGQIKVAGRDAPPAAKPSSRAPWLAAGSGATLACMFLLVLPRRRRWGALLALILSVAAIGATGCSSTTSVNGTTTKAAPGTYTVTVTATSTASNGTTLSHNSTLTVIVQ